MSLVECYCSNIQRSVFLYIKWPLWGNAAWLSHWACEIHQFTYHFQALKGTINSQVTDHFHSFLDSCTQTTKCHLAFVESHFPEFNCELPFDYKVCCNCLCKMRNCCHFICSDQPSNQEVYPDSMANFGLSIEMPHKTGSFSATSKSQL